MPSRCFDTACLAFVRSRQSEARDCTHSTSFSTTLVVMISSARAHALLHRTRWSPVEASEFREGVLVAAFSPRCALETRSPCGRIAYLLARLQPTTDVDFALVGVSRGGWFPDGSRRQLMALEAACRQAEWSYCVVGRSVVGGERG